MSVHVPSFCCIFVIVELLSDNWRKFPLSLWITFTNRFCFCLYIRKIISYHHKTGNFCTLFAHKSNLKKCHQLVTSLSPVHVCLLIRTHCIAAHHSLVWSECQHWSPVSSPTVGWDQLPRAWSRGLWPWELRGKLKQYIQIQMSLF